jgi:ferrochelatase
LSSTGILITNLGTPAAPTTKAVRHYLAEFLSDPRVVELPSFLWWPILHGIVLRTRPKKSAHAYQKIWTAEGSPLLVFGKKQQQGLNQLLQKKLNKPIHVELAMRYGSPSIKQGLENLKQKAITQLIIFPLYPQYSSAATGSTFDAIVKILKTWRYVPELHFISDYHANTDYIDAMANSIETFWQQHGRGEKLLFSFHGLPKNSIAKGDPYYLQCQTTADLIVKKLQLPETAWQVVFQSRFGFQPWLQPYCDKTLIELAKQGYKKLDVVCPGFSADCLETLEEISIRNAEMFIKAGGEQLNYIPALNDSPQHLEVLVNIVMMAVIDKSVIMSP